MAIELFDKTIAALKPGKARYAVRDTKVAGLDLTVFTDGTKRWSLRYRVHGRERRLKLGVYGRDLVTLTKARDAANAALLKIYCGIDPQAEKEAARQAAELAKRDSVEALATAYIEHAKERKRTWRNDEWLINRDIVPRWKGRAASSITHADCAAVVTAVAKRPAPILANRVAALLSAMFNFAIRRGLVSANPATRLEKPGLEAAKRPEGARTDVAYTNDEIQQIWKNTEALGASPRAIIRLGLLTGARPAEIAGMAWDEIDESTGWWTIAPSRSKNRRAHRVYLVPAARRLLADIERREGNPYVHREHRGKHQIRAANATVFAGIRRREKPRHALRHTAASLLAACGVKSEDISRVLNHIVAAGASITQTYNHHDYDAQKRIALGKLARRIEQIVEGKEAKRVVEFARRA